MNKLWARCFVLILVLLWTGPLVWAQSNARISLSVKNQPLAEVLESLESSYGIVCSFDMSLIYPHKVSARLKEVSLDKCMKVLLANKDLDYQVFGENHIIIVSTSPPEDQLTAKSVSINSPKNSNIRTLRGQVVAGDFDESLELATIRIKNKSQGINTDQNGRFRFNFSAADHDSIEFSYVGYAPQVMAISDINLSKTLRIELFPSSHSLEGITIERGTEQGVAVSNTDGSIKINPGKTAALGGLGESDVFRVIQLMPGVSSAGESASALNIRGGTSDQNLILFDGMPVYQAGHFFGLISIFNSDAVQGVVLHRSAMDAKYGGRASGVIEVTGKPLQIEEPKVGAGINLLNASAFAEIPLLKGKGALLIAGRRSYSELGESALTKNLFNNVSQQGLINYSRNLNPNKFEFDANPTFAYSDFNIKFTYRPTDRDLLTLSHFQASDQLTYDFTEYQVNNGDANYSTSDFLDLKNTGTALGWKRQWTDNYYSQFTLSHSTYQNRYSFEDRSHDTTSYENLRNGYLNNDLHDISLRFDNTWEINKKQTLEFGVQNNFVALNNHFFINSTIKGEVEKAKESESSIHKASNILSLYAQQKSKLTKKLSATYGLRYSAYNQKFDSFLEPRLSVDFQLSKFWKLKGALGRQHQFVNRIQASNSFRTGQEFWTLSDGNILPVLQSDEALLGASFETPDFLLDVEVYHKNQRGLSMYEMVYDPEFNEQFNHVLHTHGNGKIKGLDVLLQKKLGNYTGWVSYTLSSIKYQFEELNDGIPFAANHEIRQQVKWVNMFKAKNWEFSATFQFATGTPYTSIQGYQPEVLPTGRTLFKIDYNNLNEARLPNFQRLDVSASYKWKIGRLKGKTGASVLNLLNHYNVLARSYSSWQAPGGHSAPELISVDKTMLGISPNLFLQLLF